MLNSVEKAKASAKAPGPRWDVRGWVGLLCLGMLGATACEDDGLMGKKKTYRTDGGDYITRVRGAKGRKKVPVLLGATRPTGGGTVARLLIQSLDKRHTRGRFIRVLYVSDPDKVAKVRQALLSARPAPFRTCEPTWRLDVRYGHNSHTALLNISCQRLQVDGKSLAYDEKVAKILKTYIRLATLRPSHKLLRIRVPVQHDPRPILKALSSRVVEAYLPQNPVRRGPHRQIFYTLIRRAPSDPRKFDQTVTAGRRSAYSRLNAYGYQLKVGRHEVIDVQGPTVVFERFGDRVFESRYAINVLFKQSTPEYMLGFLGLGPHFTVGKVIHPKDYRIDAIFRKETRVNQMRKTLAQIKLKPPLRSY